MWKRNCESRKRIYFIYFISNDDMTGIIKTIKSLEDSSVLTGGVTEAV